MQTVGDLRENTDHDEFTDSQHETSRDQRDDRRGEEPGSGGRVLWMLFACIDIAGHVPGSPSVRLFAAHPSEPPGVPESLFSVSIV